MNKNTIWLTVCLSIFLPSILYASEITVELTWSITDTDNIDGYRMYFDYDSEMSEKQVACEGYDSPTTASSLSCTFNIDQYPIYVALATIPTDGSDELISSTQLIEDVDTIAVVKNFSLVTDNDDTTTSTVDYAINFQPADAEVPTGFTADSGSIFNYTLGYGWQTVVDETRDRNSSSSVDQSYDTIIHVDSADVWEIDLPNGSYSVTVTVGDALWPNVTNYVQAESIPIIENGVLSTDQPWIEETATVTISDGSMTFTFTGTPSETKLCWIKISSL